MSNLNKATAEWIESGNEMYTGVERTEMAIEIEHYGGSGCGSCGYECEYSASLDIWFYRDVSFAERPSYGETDKIRDLVSVDVDGPEFKDYLSFLASWVQGDKLPDA